MATKLTKPISREVEDWCRKGVFGLGGGKSRALIVTLEPGPIISFREKGTRKSYDIDLESVFNIAVRRTVDKDAADKKKSKRKRKR